MSHIAPVQSYVAVFGTLMVLTTVTVVAAFTHMGVAELPGRPRDRDHQGHGGHPVLHAREVRQQADEVRRGLLLFFLACLFGLTFTDYLSRGWYASPRGTTMAGTQVTVGPPAPARPAAEAKPEGAAEGAAAH